MGLESMRRLAGRLAVEHRVGLLPERLEKHLQRFGGVAVIVDDEHAEPAERAVGVLRRLLDRRGRQQLRTPDAERQNDAELASVTEARALGADGPAVQLDDAAHESEADAEPAEARVRRIHLRE